MLGENSVRLGEPSRSLSLFSVEGCFKYHFFNWQPKKKGIAMKVNEADREEHESLQESIVTLEGQLLEGVEGSEPLTAERRKQLEDIVAALKERLAEIESESSNGKKLKTVTDLGMQDFLDQF